MVDMKKSAEALLESAKDADIKLPRSKKECLTEAKNALKSAEDGDGDGYDMKAALRALEAKFGRGKQAGGKQAGGKAKREPADEGKANKRKKEAEGEEQSNKRGKSSTRDTGKPKEAEGEEQSNKRGKSSTRDTGKPKKAEGEEQSNKRGKSSTRDTGKPKKGSAKAGSSSSKPSSSSSAAILEDVWDISEKKELRAKAEKLVDVAKSRGVKMPEDDAQARMSAGRSLMGTKDEDGKVKVKDVIQDLEDTFGKDPNWVDPDNPGAKSKRASKAKQCTCPENQGLADAFDELAGFYFKEGSKAGLVYKKVVSTIKDLSEPMTSAPKKREIAGIGPKSIDLIKEYLETGGMELLEEKRTAANEL